MAENQLSARALEARLGEWRSGGSAYRALSERIRLLTLDGRIPTDSRLPAERDLSARLGVSRTTVTAAYRELRDTGFLVSVRGSGSMARLPGSSAVHAGPAGGGILDFSKASLPAHSALTDAAQTALGDLPGQLGGSGFDPIGIPALRRAIADRYRARGLPTDPEQIMVTIGAQHAIALVSRVLVGRGDRVMIEMPTYPHAYEALHAAGARLVPVNVSAAVPGEIVSAAVPGETVAVGVPGEDASAAGWDETTLLPAIRRTSPVLGYLMPDFHNPTGRTMPVDQRERVIAAAARAGTVLVVDETIAELDIDRDGDFLPFPAYAEPGLPDTIVAIGSVGKTIWGGLRVGWIRAERSLIRKLVAARSTTDLGTPILEQLIVARLLPGLPAILEDRRRELRVGRDHLEALLAERFPDWQVPHVDGGITTWVNLGIPVSSQLALAARNHGLLVPSGPRFGIDGAFERFLRVPFCFSNAELEVAVDALGQAWESLLRHPLPDTGYAADVV